MLFNRLSFSLRNTIFLRLIVTFLLIMLPIILLGVYLYHWVVKTASEDISKTAVSQITFYLTDLGNEIERMKLLQYGLLEDEDLNELALVWEHMDTIKRTEVINMVRKRLYTIQNSSKYIKNVNAHIHLNSKTISSADGVYELDTARYSEISSVLGGRNRQVIDWQGGLFLNAAKLGGIKGTDPVFIIEIELDTKKLQEALEQFNTYAGSGTLLFSDKSGVILASGSSQHFQKETISLIVQENDTPDSHDGIYEISGSRYYTAHASSDYLDMSIYRFIPEEIVRKPLEKFYILAWLFAAAAFGIIGVYALSTYKFIHKPMFTLVKSFRRMENGDLDVVIAHGAKDEFGYLYSRFNQMVTNLRFLIDQAYKLKIMTQRAELKQLQSQINPHFLYNSFFILSTMAKTGDVERIEQFTRQLGEYFQFVTRNASDEVTLKQEIHHARMYTEIQELRFSRRIRVQFESLPVEFESVLVPRLIVQPIIENAFEHSLEHMAHSGLVVVRFERVETDIRIVVEDNGDRLTDEVLHRIEASLANEDDRTETTGMVNIHRRIKIMFGEGYGIEASRSGLGGLKVTTTFPFKGGDARV